MDQPQALAHLLAASRRRIAWDGIFDDRLLAAARQHDVAPLVYHALRAHGVWDRQPAAARDALSRLAVSAALVEEVRQTHVRAVLAALDAAGLTPIVFKGTALAYGYYTDPSLRPRLDTDLFIRADQLHSAAAAFTRLGLTRSLRPAGDHLTYQQTYQTMAHGVRHQYDVHWKLSDPQVFAELMGDDELSRDARPLPALGPSARTVSGVHALLIACVHRVAHHFNSMSLLWLYDIDLIARTLDNSAWIRVADLAAEKRIRQVCAHGLTLAQRLFDTPVPARVSTALAAGGVLEPTAAYLRDDLRRVDILRSDLQALSWRARARLLREHLLPPPGYVLRSYRQTQPLLLPALYVHRIVRGAVDWFRPLRG